MYANFEILGNVAQEIQLKEVKGKQGEVLTTCHLSLSIKNKNESISYFDVSAWNGKAKYLSDYIKKGDMLLVKGYIKYYKDKDNKSRYEYVLDDLFFIKHATNKYKYDNNINKQ